MPLIGKEILSHLPKENAWHLIQYSLIAINSLVHVIGPVCNSEERWLLPFKIQNLRKHKEKIFHHLKLELLKINRCILNLIENRFVIKHYCERRER